MSAQKDVTVIVDGRTTRVSAHAFDVEDVLLAANIEVDDADLVTPPESSRVHSGDTIVVRHSVPVTLRLGRRSLKLDVVGETVADALVSAGIEPGENPTVRPALDAPLKPGIVVEAPERLVRVEQESVHVPFRTVLKRDPTRPVGERKVVHEGQPGTRMLVWKVTVDEGIESSRTLSAECTVAPVRDRVVVVGSSPKVMFASWHRSVTDSRPASARHDMTVVATGYSPAQPDLDYTMATGLRAGRGYIAVDPHVIPLGTHVWVPGYGEAIAADTGGAIDGNRIDLCFDSVAEAMAWGRRTVTIVILD